MQKVERDVQKANEDIAKLLVRRERLKQTIETATRRDKELVKKIEEIQNNYYLRYAPAIRQKRARKKGYAFFFTFLVGNSLTDHHVRIPLNDSSAAVMEIIL